jgi:Uri superfamily endonuclease
MTDEALARHFWTSAEKIPKLPGAYVLAIELSQPIVVKLGNGPAISLAAGRYLYCGSAKGPGGLRARIARHMRHAKTRRWHIDRLTEVGRVLGAWTFIGGHECELVAALAHLPVPIEGFGSTDCHRCRSHLLRWPETRRTKPGSLLHSSLMVGPGKASQRKRELE